MLGSGETTFLGNITAPNLMGIAYNSNFLLQTGDYSTAIVISNHLHVNLNGKKDTQCVVSFIIM